MRLKDMAMELTEDWRTKTAAVTKERTRMEKELDALRDEIKEPLDKWKEKEEIRKAQHEADILEIEQASTGSWADMTLEQLQERRESLKKFEGKEWQEFSLRAEQALNTTITILDDGIAKRKKYDAEQAELSEARRKREEEEKREAERKTAHESLLKDLDVFGNITWADNTVEQIEEQIKDLVLHKERDWEEYKESALAKIDELVGWLNIQITQRKTIS